MTELNSPNRKHIAIIGAGIVGVSCGLWLQRAGHQITLIDPRGPAGGASHGNAGVLAAASVVPVPVPGLLRKVPGMLLDKAAPLFVRASYLPQLLPFLGKYLRHANARDVNRIADALALLLHDTYEQHMALAAGTGAERFLSPGDYVYGYQNRQNYEKDSFTWAVRRARGFAIEELKAGQLAQYDPTLKDRFGFAARCLNHGRVSDPGNYVRALAASLISNGAAMRKTRAVDIKLNDDAATGVMTPEGLIDADEVVLAGGVWSGPLARKLRLSVPMEAEGGYHVEWVNPSFMPRSPTMVAAGKFVMTPMDGRLRCAGVLEFGGINDQRNEAALALLKTQTKALLPDLKYDRIDEWMGFRPAPADSIPLIGAIGGIRNAWAGFGHHHVGLTSGPKTGRWLAGLIDKTLPPQEIAAFTPKRFRVR